MSTMSGKLRLSIFLSALWVGIWFLVFLNNPVVQDFRTSQKWFNWAEFSRFLFLGVAPIAVAWGIRWVWTGFRKPESAGRIRSRSEHMNRKQLSAISIAAILIVVLLGLENRSEAWRSSPLDKPYTGEVFPLSAQPNGPEIGHTLAPPPGFVPVDAYYSLFFYGIHVHSSENVGALHPILNLGKYKYELIAAVVMLCGLLVVMFRKSKSEQ